MKYRLSLLAMLLVCAASAHAEMYKWVGEDGKITYSDVPPPKTAKQVEKKFMGSSGPDTAGLPYELAEAVKNNPVTLYTTVKCPSCDLGRKLLVNRGIPYSEKTVTTNEDIAMVQELSGVKTVPVLTIGRSKETSFRSDAWDAALTAAGYPATNQLPKNFNNSKAEAAAPVAKVETPAKAEPAPNQNNAAPEAPVRTPGGFRF